MTSAAQHQDAKRSSTSKSLRSVAGRFAAALIPHTRRSDAPEPRAPGLPAGTWFRVIEQLPAEPRPREHNLVLVGALEQGARVYLDLREGAIRVSGWGVVKHFPEPFGWHVEFPDGSAVGMPRRTLKKHCLTSTRSPRRASFNRSR